VEAAQAVVPATLQVEAPPVAIPEIPLLPPIYRRKRMESLRRSPAPEIMAILKRSQEPETTAIPKKNPAPETTAILKRSPAQEKAESRKRIPHRNNLRKRMLLSWWEKPR